MMKDDLIEQALQEAGVFPPSVMDHHYGDKPEMTKVEIIVRSLEEMGLLALSEQDAECGNKIRYIHIVIAELQRRLPDGDIVTCGAFRDLGAGCCDECHTDPLHGMKLVELPGCTWAWLCCAVDAASSPEPYPIIHEREQDSPEGRMRTCKYRNGGRKEDYRCGAIPIHMDPRQKLAGQVPPWFNMNGDVRHSLMPFGFQCGDGWQPGQGTDCNRPPARQVVPLPTGNPCGRIPARHGTRWQAESRHGDSRENHLGKYFGKRGRLAAQPSAFDTCATPARYGRYGRCPPICSRGAPRSFGDPYLCTLSYESSKSRIYPFFQWTKKNGGAFHMTCGPGGGLNRCGLSPTSSSAEGDLLGPPFTATCLGALPHGWLTL